MKVTRALLIASGLVMIASAGLFTSSLFLPKVQQITYSAGDPVTQAEFERLLRKHGVAFTPIGPSQKTQHSSNGVTNISIREGVIIKNGGARNTVAALNEYSSWLAANSRLGTQSK